MAGENCSLTCNVRDPRTGDVKVSALWDDLSKFFKGDRRQAVTHYFLTKDSNFLRENSDVLEFDVDGEVTIASLKKALERDGEYSNLSNARTLEHLNREIKAGRYNYSEALDNVLKFNKSNQFREGFMATLKKEADGSYSVKVVERNPQSEYELADHVQNKLLTDALRIVLEQKGLSVEFLDNPSYVYKYSTYNNVFGIDGLKAVAHVMSGINSSSATAEVAGHFIVGAMENNPLVDRLINQLTQEVQQAIFKDSKSNLYREDFIVSDSSAKEAAGILVGRALISPFRETSQNSSVLTKTGSSIPKAVKWLLSKIKTFAQKVLGTYTPDVVSRMIQEAKDTAATVSEGYLNSPESADASNIFNTPETFVSVRSSKYLSDAVRENVGAFKETVGFLKESISALRDVVGRSEGTTNRDILSKLRELHKNITSAKIPMLDMDAFAERASIEGMVYTIEGITQILDTDVRTLLDSIQPSDRTDSQIKIVENARNMRTVETLVRNMAQLYLVMSEKVDRLNAVEKIQFADADGNQVVESLREALGRLSNVLMGNEESYIDVQNAEQKVPGLKRLMELKTRQVSSDFLENVLGRDYIERNAGVIWRQEGSSVKLIRSDKIKGYNEIYMKDWLASMDEDISIIDRYLKSAADCGDLVTSVGYKVTRNANMQADRITEKFMDSVESLYAQMKDIFGSTDCSFLYETMTDEEGRIVKTGNLIAPVKYGQWEADREKFKKELKSGFGDYLAEIKRQAYENNKNNPGFTFKLTDFQKGVLWHNYADPLWQKWNDAHCIEDPLTFGSKKMVPDPVMYHSEQWDALFDMKNPSLTEEERNERKRRLQWYNALMEMKDEIDSMLPVNSTVRWRAPQFTGNTYHRFKNLQAKMQNSRAALGNALRRKAQDMVIVRQDEAYLFGSNNEFNEIEEDPLENNMYFEKEKKNRLPLFGINKLKNMDDLSTDLFGNMLRYASMASTFKALSTIVDVLELFSDALKHRKVEGIVESERKKESRAHARYMKFLQNNLYGVAITPPRWDRKGTLRKLAGQLSGMSSALFLGGNVAGGVVNTGTGMIEIFKEASTGEFFTTDDVVKAHKLYYDGLLNKDGYLSSFTNMLTNPQRPMDKNNLWIRHWNMLGKNKKFFGEQKYDVNAVNNRLWDWFGHCLWLPYSSGDHYMQCIPFYALGVHEKVYDKDGNIMSLIDAYEIAGDEDIYAVGDESGRSIGKTPKVLRLKDNIFRSTADIDKFEKIQGMINKTADFFENHQNLKGNIPLALDFFTNEEKQLLEEEDMNVPTTVKQLETLRTAMALKAGELKYNENDESIFMDKCRNITNRLHGIYNSEDKTTMHQNFFGNLFMAMKGYALGYINRNFAPNSYNLTVNKSTEGSFQTLGKVLAYYFSGMDNIDNWKALTEALMLCVPGANLYTLFSKNYNNRLSSDMQKMGFSEHQFYNMRRMGVNFLAIEALFLLGMLTAKDGPIGPKKDDDKDEESTYGNTAVGVAYYLTQRWNREQNAYVTPWGMWDEAGSLMSIPVGFSGFGKVWEISTLYGRTKLDQIDDNPDYENSDLYYQSSKKDLYEVGDEKWKKKANRYIPYYRSWYVLEHPYDAAANFEYGRKVRK